MEIWKDITNYEGIYQVSNLGRIKSLGGTGKSIKKEKILKLTLKNGSYYGVILFKNSNNQSLRVHRIVAKEFILNSENKTVVNHKDGNGLNNEASNLEWVTTKENVHHCRYQTKNGKVISKKKILELYEEDKKLSLNEFIDKLLNNIK